MDDKLKSLQDSYRQKQLEGVGDNRAKERSGDHRANLRKYDAKKAQIRQEVKKQSGYHKGR